MKYFTKEFPKADNSRSLSKAQQQAIYRKFVRNSEAYKKQLRKLEGRISRQAWNFFCLGFGRWGLTMHAFYPSPQATDWTIHVMEGCRSNSTGKRQE
jgi:hypothetical protein